MNRTRVIELKRDGGEIPEDDLRVFLDSYLSGSVADYHVSAFLMAVMFRGMSARELATISPAHAEDNAHGLGRELFGGMRRNVNSAEEGACTWL